MRPGGPAVQRCSPAISPGRPPPRPGRLAFRPAVLAALLLIAAVAAGTVGPASSQEPLTTAVLQGRVRLADGPMPAPERFENTLDPEGCGRWRTRREVRVHPDDRGVADVVVAVADGPPAPRKGSDPGRLVLDHRDCRFEPRVAVLGVGGIIETVNRDHVIHTAHLHGALEGNLALPLHGQSITVTADRPGMITVLCDLHRWMRAFVRVDPHPFHAVTDAHGRFRIADLPAGEHELELWHERLGRRLRAVSLQAGAEVEVEFVLDAPDAAVENH